jgi:2-amino-4-hydroxy-6-hydroxymethyldihydropteridine diphosphokinase
MLTEAFVGLGSNIDPEHHLNVALEKIQDRLMLVEISPVYRNAAVGFTGNDFLNLVIRLQCAGGPVALEKNLSEIEQASGRQRTSLSTAAEEIMSRTLDLDLLLYGSVVDPDLGLPRSDVLRYAFVLRPLAELSPELVHPVTGRIMRVEWEATADQSPLMQSQQIFVPDHRGTF